MTKHIRRTIVAAGLTVAISGGVAATAVAHAGTAPSRREEPTVNRAVPTTGPRSCPRDTALCRLGGTDRPSACSLEAVICRNQAHVSTRVANVATPMNQAESVLPYINGDLGRLSGIIDQVTDDPNAPLTPEQIGFVDDLNRRTRSFNNTVGLINEQDGMYGDTMRDMERQRDEQIQHDAVYNAITEINRQITQINAVDPSGELSDLYLLNMPQPPEPYDHDYADPGYSAPSYSPPAYSPPTSSAPSYSPPEETTPTNPMPSPSMPGLAQARSDV